jgi:hypothetical protein
VHGDGKTDIAWRDSSGTTAAWLMNGAQILTSGGVGAAAANWPLGAIPTNWQIIGQRDFNGDGMDDWLWRDANSGTVAIWLLNGLSILQSGGLGTVPSNWVISGTSDFNTDGNGDILWRDANSGTVAIWLLDARITVTRSALQPMSTAFAASAYCRSVDSRLCSARALGIQLQMFGVRSLSQVGWLQNRFHTR